jgi:hypothetical protein
MPQKLSKDRIKMRKMKQKLGKGLRSNLPLMQAMIKMSPKDRRTCCSAGVCAAFEEVCLNLLEGNIPLTPKEKASLKKRAPAIEKVAKRSTSLKAKRDIIQKGGFIGALLGPALRLLGPALGGIASAIGSSIRNTYNSTSGN